MEDYRFVYLAIWMICVGFAAWIIIKDFSRFKIEVFKYRYYLTRPWKLVTFAIAGSFVTFAGPYTNDPTWDYVSGSAMSVLTYLTAPWSIGVLFQVLKNQRKISDAVLAIILLLLSASWFYDGYLWLRDGYYPVTWFWNLVVSSTLYFCAGLFWNFEAPNGLVGFGFYRMNWPEKPLSDELKPIIKHLLLFMIIVICILVFSTTWHF